MRELDKEDEKNDEHDEGEGEGEEDTPGTETPASEEAPPPGGKAAEADTSAETDIARTFTNGARTEGGGRGARNQGIRRGCNALVHELLNLRVSFWVGSRSGGKAVTCEL